MAQEVTYAADASARGTSELPERERAKADARQPQKGAKRPRKPADKRKNLEIFFFVSPALLLIAVFMLVPIIQAVRFSVYNWKGFGPLVDFVGLKNYVRVLGNEVFTDALVHNLIIIGGSIALQLPIGLGIALLLNRKMKIQSLLRTIIFVPYVLSEAIAGVVWFQLLQPQYGVIDTIMNKLGIDGPAQGWLGTPELALWTVLAVLTWKYLGLAVILFLAGLQGVPSELYEAAEIDGASWWQIQRKITIPLLGPTLRTWGVLVHDRLAAAVRHGLDPHRRRPGQRHDHDGHLPGFGRDQAPELRHCRGRLGHLVRRRPGPGHFLPAVHPQAGYAAR
ncbi:carbohydrate ABC transporter permease [Glutamicibacter arilaitensis]|uniref:carbohydrate ABC transporter permease n=1 Tax=Glutamicibacter arilaitensis TaxID=256701 RepID=UPI003F90802F